MPTPIERRRFPRIQVDHYPGLPDSIVDVSLGGFAINLPVRLPRGSVHDVALSFGNGQEVAVRVRVAYSRPADAPDAQETYVTGFEYLADVTHVPSRRTLRLAS